MTPQEHLDKAEDVLKEMHQRILKQQGSMPEIMAVVALAHAAVAIGIVALTSSHRAARRGLL